MLFLNHFISDLWSNATPVEAPDVTNDKDDRKLIESSSPDPVEVEATGQNDVEAQTTNERTGKAAKKAKEKTRRSESEEEG